jgi:hypothetical protein
MSRHCNAFWADTIIKVSIDAKRYFYCNFKCLSFFSKPFLFLFEYSMSLGPSWHKAAMPSCLMLPIETIHSIQIERERANMHCEGIACTRSFYMDLASAEG